MTKQAKLERVRARPDPALRADDELLTLVEAAALIAVARRLFGGAASLAPRLPRCSRPAVRRSS
ncbi:hypothetical protein ACVWXM_005480 [Bradyrhizobium sp. GM7.3]